METITRKELFMAKVAGQNVNVPEPITREEKYLKQMADNSVSKYFGESTEVLFDQRVEISDDELNQRWVMEQALPISIGDSVRVTFNGVKYELTAQPAPGVPGLVYFGGPDNEIPFGVVTGSDDIGEFTEISAPDYAGQFVSVKVEGVIVKTLDPKFIPAGVGGGVVIVQDSAMASGVAVASQAHATATMNAAEIAEAIFAGKTVFFLDWYSGNLMPFTGGSRFADFVSGVMPIVSAPTTYALFSYENESGAVMGVKVLDDGSYVAFEYGYEGA